MSPLRVAPGVAVETHDDVTYVARLPEGPILVLDGTAALIWEQACDRDRRRVAERVAAELGIEPAEIAADVSAFVDDLVAQSLLVQSR